jgi:hypothetical protein
MIKFKFLSKKIQFYNICHHKLNSFPIFKYFYKIGDINKCMLTIFIKKWNVLIFENLYTLVKQYFLNNQNIYRYKIHLCKTDQWILQRQKYENFTNKVFDSPTATYL